MPVRRAEIVMSMMFYHKTLVVLAVAIFYTNLPLYLYINHGSTGMEAPKLWVLGFCLFTLPVLFREMTVWKALKSPAALWCLGYAWLTVMSFLLSAQSEMNWQEVRWRFLTIIELLIFLMLFANADANKLARQTVMVAVLWGVAINMYELFVPLAFSRVLGRSAGMYMDPNVTAEALVLGMIFGVTILAPAYRSPFVLLTGLGVFLTLSRAGIGGWIIAAAAMTLGGLVRLKSLLLSVFLCMMLIVVWLLPQWDQLLTTWERTGVINNNLLERLDWMLDPTGVSDYSGWLRAHVAKQSWAKVADHPVLGNGPGASLEAEVGTHNTYLMFMVDHGVVGVLILPLLLVAVTVGVGGQSRGVAVIFGCIVLFLSLFTHTTLYREQGVLLFALMAAMTIESHEIQNKKTVLVNLAQRSGEAWAR